jgi:hypothetical protein
MPIYSGLETSPPTRDGGEKLSAHETPRGKALSMVINYSSAEGKDRSEEVDHDRCGFIKEQSKDLIGDSKATH